MVLAGLAELFVIGIATPLTATCVLPLYPAFLAFLASVGDEDRSVALLGVLVVAGVLTFVALVGALFAAVLETPVSVVVGSVSPLAFFVLAVVGFVLVIDPDAFSRLPAVEPPQSRSPALSAFGYGFFFGATVLPCNPGLIALFFARQPVLFDTRFESVLGFLAFGLGIGAPLLAFALLSEPFGRRVTRTLARYSRPINRVVGAILLAVSTYYLVFVFAVVPGL